MATQTKILRTTVAYPISKLAAINAINQNSLLELSVKTSDKPDRWESRKTTIADFGNYLITAHAIFNNLYDLYCTKADAITFTKPAYFSTRPHVKHITNDMTEAQAIKYLKDNPVSSDTSLVTLYDVKEYIKNTGIAVQAVGVGSTYRQYTTNNGWTTLNYEDMPKIIAADGTANIMPVYASTNCPIFNYTHISDTGINGFATNEITVEKDMMINVIANFVLNSKYSELIKSAPTPYYNYSASNWLALIIPGQNNEPVVGTITRFTDIVNVNDYAIAQVKLSMPIGKNTKFYLFTPADINTNQSVVANISANTKFQRSLFAGVNAAHIGYFDNEFATSN